MSVLWINNQHASWPTSQPKKKLTPKSRVLHDKLVTSQELSPFYGTQRFMTVFREPITFPYPEPDEATQSHVIVFL